MQCKYVLYYLCFPNKLPAFLHVSKNSFDTLLLISLNSTYSCILHNFPNLF